MPEPKLALAYSPCPNDTFIFAAWANELLEGAPHVRVHLYDIENLNSSAVKAQYPLTKVSYGAVPLLMDRYRILRSGGALGRGCGPLVVARPGTGKSLEDFHDKLIAIPGEMTTAFMLLRLAMEGRPQTLGMRFDNIIDAVAQGTVDAGLIIHESRFTYGESGLVEVADLGQWWERHTNMPIPLGAVLVRDDVSARKASEVDAIIKRSLKFARDHEGQIMPYVRRHATEMSENVMRKHIGLYVNAYTQDVGAEGIAAVEELFARAHAANAIPEQTQPRFVDDPR